MSHGCVPFSASSRGDTIISQVRMDQALRPSPDRLAIGPGGQGRQCRDGVEWLLTIRSNDFTLSIHPDDWNAQLVAWPYIVKQALRGMQPAPVADAPPGFEKVLVG